MAQLGYYVPLFNKRGYHAHFAAEEGPRVPIIDVANGVFLTPMAKRLRITSGVELATDEAPKSPVQLTRGIAGVRELFALGKKLDSEPWLGSRPCLPDMLPLVGRAPHHDGLWMNFGHGHHGFTMGPTTDRLLADLLDRKNDQAVLADALSPARGVCERTFEIPDSNPVTRDPFN